MSNDLQRRVEALKRDIADLRRTAAIVSVPVLGNIADAREWARTYRHMRDRVYATDYVPEARGRREGGDDRDSSCPVPQATPHPLSRPMVMRTEPASGGSVPLTRGW